MLSGFLLSQTLTTRIPSSSSDGGLLGTFKGYNFTTLSLIELPDGRLASGHKDTSIQIWSLADDDCQQQMRLSGHSHWVIALCALGDDRLISGSCDGTIKIWDLSSRNFIATLSGHVSKSSVRSVLVLSDGSTMASGSSDKTLKIWDMTTMQCIQTLKGHSNNVNAIVELRSGIIASGSDDKTIKLWNTVTGECLYTIKCTNSIDYLISLPGGVRGRLISGSCNSTDMVIWSEEVKSGKGSLRMQLLSRFT